MQRLGWGYSRPSSQAPRCLHRVSDHICLGWLYFSYLCLTYGVDVDNVVGAKEMGRNRPYDLDASPVSDSESFDMDCYQSDKTPDPDDLDGNHSILKVLTGVSEDLWNAAEPSLRVDLWDNVVSSVQVALLSPDPQAQPITIQGNSCKGTETTSPDAGGVPEGTAAPDSMSGENVANNTRHPKRKRRREDDGEGDENGDGDGNEPGLSGPGGSDLNSLDVMFGCPYMKMFPWVYIHKRSCLGAWPNASRLK